MAEVLRGTRRLHYVVHPAEPATAAPTLVLVPGLGSGMRLFGTLPRRFARDGHRTLTFDPVGVPPSSDLDAPFTFERAVADLLAVMDAAEAERVDLVGTSLGGKVALALAAAAPQRIRRTVLLASSAVRSARARRIYQFFAAVAEHLPADRFADAVTPFLFGQSFHTERPQVIDDIARATRPSSSTRQLMISQARALIDWDGTSVARKVACPVLLIAGAEDTLTDEADVEATAALLADASFERAPRAGHSLLLEDPNAYRRVCDFLRP